jgi:hypothetical protein
MVGERYLVLEVAERTLESMAPTRKIVYIGEDRKEAFKEVEPYPDPYSVTLHTLSASPDKTRLTIQTENPTMRGSGSGICISRKVLETLLQQLDKD